MLKGMKTLDLKFIRYKKITAYIGPKLIFTCDAGLIVILTMAKKSECE